MKTEKKDLIFNQENSTVLFDGKVIIDFSKVETSCEAKLYSGVTSDFEGMRTSFKIMNSKRPFDIGFTSLSLPGFVYALVENRLEVDGMVVSEKIIEAYLYILENDPLAATLSKNKESRVYPC